MRVHDIIPVKWENGSGPSPRGEGMKGKSADAGKPVYSVLAHPVQNVLNALKCLCSTYL